MKPDWQAIAENRLLDRWQGLLSRCPDQVNRPHETDAELIPLPGTDKLLALTVDTVAEEIALGFYREPETIGWMGATVSLSDLAAVGARPLGLVVSVTLPQGVDSAFQEGVARGLEAACRAAGTYVLGGDTNSATQAGITACAAGLVERDQFLTRRGCSPGEVVYASGPLGAGASAAARVLFDLPNELYSEVDYRPRARLAEARLLVGFASCCMDTSDGLIATLDQLLRLNGVGFELTAPLATVLEQHSRAVSEHLGVPPLLMLAVPHGEFELVFTVRTADREHFEAHARAQGFAPVLLGRTLEEPILRVAGDPPLAVDGTRIRNLLEEVGGDLQRYMAELRRIVAGD